MACDAEGEPVQEWKLTDAYPTSYSCRGHGGRAARTS